MLLLVGGIMWKQRQDAAQEQIERFETNSEEWQKKLVITDSDATFGMNGT